MSTSRRTLLIIVALAVAALVSTPVIVRAGWIGGTSVGPAVLQPQAAPPVAAIPAPQPEPAPPTSLLRPFPETDSAPVDAVLAANLTTLLDDPRLRTGGAVSLVVVDGDNRSVLSTGGDVALLPASTQKLLPAAAALATLGPAYRYRTKVNATGPVRAGVLEGDLVLVGSGDPALATPEYSRRIDMGRPATPLAALADQLAAAGVRRITGRVIGDTSYFRHQPYPRGWRPDYFSSLDAAPVSGLTVDVGRHLFVRRGRLLAEPARDPGMEAAVQLTRLLVQRRIAVEHRATVTHTPGPPGATVAEVRSPPLRELLQHMVQESDNHLAEGIFRTVGAATGDPTWAGAATGVQSMLAPLGLDWTGAVLADGSGLSRTNRVTAQLLAALDARMSRSSLGSEWTRLMSVAGVSGTLEGRLQGTVAEGRLRGKTGTLDDVRALTGSVGGRGLERYHFALLANSLDGDGAARARQLQDNIAVALARHLDACQRSPFACAA